MRQQSTPSFASALAWLLLALLWTGCAARQKELPCEADSRCLRYGLSADFPVLDPHRGDLAEAGIVFRQLYDTLVYRDSDSHQFLPGLASGWEVSADGRLYTFTLRQDALFHDGAPFNAEAVARNIERIYAEQSTPSRARQLLGPLSEYEIVDAYTLRLRLSEPYPALLDALAQPWLGMASPRALDEYGELRYQFHQAGTGPFKLEFYTPGEVAALRRNTDYRVNPAIYAPLTGEEIQRIEFMLATQSTNDIMAQLDTTLDIVDDISPGSAQNMAGNSRVQLLPSQLPALSIGLLLNSARPPLDNSDARRALLLATDRAAISDSVFFNFAPVAWTPLAASTRHAHNGYISRFAHDPAAALDLLSAAGYSDSDADGILDRAGLPLSLRMVVPPWDQLPQVASLLRESWRELGIDLRLEPVPGKARLIELALTGEYDLLPYATAGIDPVMLDEIFADSSPYAASRAPQARLSQLLSQARREIDPQLRRNLVYELQALLMNETLIIPLIQPSRLRLATADARGLRFDAYGMYPLLSNVVIDPE